MIYRFYYSHLLLNLVKKDMKLKYRGSFLGFLWSLLNPLALILVYTVAFKYIIRIKLDNYSIFLLAGVLPWNFFIGSLNMATTSIIDNGNLIKKIYFPREVLPISTVLFNFVQLVLAYVVLIPLVIMKTGLHTVLLLLPLVLVFHLLFTIGLSFFVSAITVFFRDMKHIIEVFLLLLFWVTPIIYPMTMIPERFRLIVKLNPMTLFTLCYQDIIFSHRLPGLYEFGAIIVWILVTLAAGYRTFNFYGAKFAEEV